MSDAPHSIDNVNIVSQDLLPTPQEIRDRNPLNDDLVRFVHDSREQVKRILSRSDHRLMVVVGPCSIHDLDAAREYATRLKALAEEVKDTLLLVMRVYFEKPRTTIGWKGFINDPYLDDSFQIGDGLYQAREFLVQLAEIGVPVGSEALDPITPQYLGDLVSWVAIGARTTESQTHRDMASGLSAPVGFKNATDGNVDIAVNALQAVTHPQHFLGVTPDGRCAVFHTRGNRYGHIILRGGRTRPNYDSVSVAMCEEALDKAKLGANIVVDCSHGNSLKKPELQPLVLKSVVDQIRNGNRSIIGVMLESHLKFGRQTISADPSQLERGVSVTDACIGWDTTAEILRETRERLNDVLPTRPAPENVPPPSQIAPPENDV
ncbi:MAG: 3-deoxy-7-phosphoheptulonate synthase [Polyangiaceae bacterium]